MTDKFRVRRNAGTTFEREEWADLDEFERYIGSKFVFVPDPTLTLSNKHQGIALAFTAACVVTIPPGLRPDFSVGWMQASAQQLTFVAGAGVTVNSQGALLKSQSQWAIGAISGMGPDTFLLFGALA